MPLVYLSLVLQFVCLVHMVRSGKPYWWIWLIMLGSYLGVAVYFFTQILPELRNDPMARAAVRNVQKKLDPERDRKRIAAQLDVADTISNRIKLAHECLELGDVLYAEELFGSCLKGPHANDPDILLGLAKAQFGRGDAAAAKQTLETLIAANPDFKSEEGHLLYARSLEGLGDVQRALHEYSALSLSYPGEEGRARYALLLKRSGQLQEARQVFEQILKRVKVAPKYYQRTQKEWVTLAEEQLRV